MPFQEDGRPLSQADRDRMAAILGESCRQGSGNPTEGDAMAAELKAAMERDIEAIRADMERALASKETTAQN